MAMTKLIRTTIIVYGDVQKADYRGRVIKIAKKMVVDGGITGIVQNLKDGNVKIIAEGDKSDIDWFCDKIRIQNFLIDVTDIKRFKDIEIGEDEREFEDFSKVVGEGETDERLDRAAELLKGLAEDMRNGFKEQMEYNKRIDKFIGRMDEHNTKIDEHNSRLEKILEKLTEK